MSYTEIVKFGKSGKAEGLIDIKNAWRGAVAIWNIVGDRYLGKYIPDYVKNNPSIPQRDSYSRLGDEGELKKVWSLLNDDKVSEVDRICLGTTMDWVIVRRKNLPELIKAFREFEGETSLKEQADAIEAAMNEDSELKAIAWNQTSVCENRWLSYKYHNLKDESYPYNLKRHKEHWNLFEEEAESHKEQEKQGVNN